MKFCIQCGHKLCGKQTKYCSKECSNTYVRLKIINDKISANKIFSDNASETIFKKTKNNTKKLIVTDILSYEDKCFLNWHIKESKLKRTYLEKTVKFVRNNTYMSRKINQLALSIKDLECIINSIEIKMKKTHRTELKLTIKKILSFRDRWIENLKGQTNER